MYPVRTGARRLWLAAIFVVLIAALATLWLKPMLEQTVRTRIEAAAARQGVTVRIALLHIGVWPLLRLENVDVDAGHGVRLHADRISATWPARLRLAVRSGWLTGPAEIKVSAPATAWDVAGLRSGDLQLTLVAPRPGLSLRKRSDGAGSAWSVEARELDVGHLFDIRRDNHPLLDGGVTSGRVELRSNKETLRFHIDLSARGTRVAALSESAEDDPQLGEPTDVALRFDGTWRGPKNTIDIPDLHATVAGASLSGSLALRDLDSNPSIDLALGVQQLDFAQLLGTSGLAIPDSLGVPPGGTTELGIAAIDLQVHGRLADPASLKVTQKIDFKPPRQIPPGIARLLSDFTFTPDDGSGPHRPVDVSNASPDFIPLRDVPPLFVRTLLLAEDSSFYGHRGVDFRELPVALLANWSRGGAARGASTLTQQLAKNLFLSRDKQLGRKLQELAITFLLESALGKDRILEIYLNIIEWGPDLRGLRPAARTYFGREPQALTPAQMAFLVSIIPAPIKYQSSFAHGTPGPGLQKLVDDLLAKLRSVDAIDEEEYRRALAEPIVVGGGGAGV